MLGAVVAAAVDPDATLTGLVDEHETTPAHLERGPGALSAQAVITIAAQGTLSAAQEVEPAKGS